MKMKSRFLNRSVALSIAGSDCSAGAGIQADLKTFSSIGVFGMTVLSCVVAENPLKVWSIQPVTGAMLRDQITACFDRAEIKAVKTGMLYSSPLIEEVSREMKSRKVRFLVVDPVMISTSGTPLLKKDAIHSLENRLLKCCHLMTPNLDEAAFLLGRKIQSLDELRIGAIELHEKYGCNVLLKGGHLRSEARAWDVLYDGRKIVQFSSPYVRKVSTHGTGCTYSAAITAYLAQGFALEEAVKNAKKFIVEAIRHSVRVGGYTQLNCFWKVS